MRKPILVLFVLALLPAAAFADFGIGGAAFYSSPVLLGQSVDKDNLSVDQFTFGGDARLRLNVLQGEALLLYATGADVQSIAMYLDAGVAFDLLMFRLGAGVGPNFVINLGESHDAVQAGMNAKVSADLKLGALSVGLSYIMDFNFSDGGINVNTSSGLLGAQVLFWM